MPTLWCGLPIAGKERKMISREALTKNEKMVLDGLVSHAEEKKGVEMNLIEFRNKLNETIDDAWSQGYDPSDVDVHIQVSLPNHDAFSGDIVFHFDGQGMVDGCVIEGIDGDME